MDLVRDPWCHLSLGSDRSGIDIGLSQTHRTEADDPVGQDDRTGQGRDTVGGADGFQQVVEIADIVDRELEVFRGILPRKPGSGQGTIPDAQQVKRFPGGKVC